MFLVPEDKDLDVNVNDGHPIIFMRKRFIYESLLLII